MGEILSQKEIDSLLNDISSGVLSVDEILSNVSKKSDIMTYDFRRPNRVSKNQIKSLSNIHENFSEVFAYYLVSKLQNLVSINVVAIDQLFYSEFILSVSSPGCLYIFDFKGVEGSGIMEVSPSLALHFVERLLGGEADNKPKSRSITPIEQAVIRNLIEHALSDLTKSWSVIGDLKFILNRMESEADFVQVAPSSEIVIVVSLEVLIGNNSFSMSICYPTFALEEILTKLSKQQVSTAFPPSGNSVRDNKKAIQSSIEKSKLPLSVELGKTHMTIEELLQLKVDDVLKLDKKITDELEVSIAGQKKLLARPGNIDNKKAIKIVDKITENKLID